VPRHEQRAAEQQRAHNQTANEQKSSHENLRV
jgi:hypothetical protein